MTRPSLKFTASERDQYVAVIAAFVAARGRPPTAAEFREECRVDTMRPYRCLVKFVGNGNASWPNILKQLGYAPISVGECRRLDRLACSAGERRRVYEAGALRYEGKQYATCLNAPDCTGVPPNPGLRFCAACDPRERSQGMDAAMLHGVRVRRRGDPRAGAGGGILGFDFPRRR